MTTPLLTFLQKHRVAKGDTNYAEWNLTGITTGVDKGTYVVGDEEYDHFLELVNNHIFGATPKTSSLLERHRENGPLLVDLDFRYAGGGRLMRRFGADHIKRFIAHYAAAMIYFTKVENLPHDLDFYVTLKPAPEADKDMHKDGVHIECPTLTTAPKLQYGIRGFLLQHGIVASVFGATGVTNPAEEVYDVAVIHRNNWFLYGACKPNKSQYSVTQVWRLSVEDVNTMLDGGDPTEYEELISIVEDALVAVMPPATTLEVMKTLSIRRGHHAQTPLPVRTVRNEEWMDLMIGWGSGHARSDRGTAPVRNTIDFETDADGAVAAGGAGDVLVVTEPEDSLRVTSAITAEDIALAYRLARECLNAERRAGEYHDWVNLAICLKNIANTDESFKVWCELTRAVDSAHKKARMSDAELRTKWGLIRVDATKKLGMGSLQHWAEEDNPDKRRSILSESLTEWIICYARKTHASIAEFVCRKYRYEFRCCLGQKKNSYEWYRFAANAHNWKHLRTTTELRSRLSDRIKDEYAEAWRKLGKRAEGTADSQKMSGVDDKRKALRDIELKLEDAGYKDQVMRECGEKFYDDAFIGNLNKDPYLVGVANGVLELHHYEEGHVGRPHVYFRDGRPDDNVSFQMGNSDPDIEAIPYAPYDPALPEQKELAGFFERIYPDPVLREYVLTLLSSCLEGRNQEQKFYVMQGRGGNGKSMVELLMELTFGDYGTSISTAVFTRKRPDAGAANPDIITVQKRRFIHCGEPDDGEKFNTSVIKQWTGGDRVNARGLFADQEKFSIMGKIFMSCNDLPPVAKMDHGTWRRLRVIPHVSTFKDPGDPTIDPAKNIYEKDLFLETKLYHWRTAFLSLLVHYYETRYLAGPLKEPDCVMVASNKYKEQNDTFNRFINDNFKRDASAGGLREKEIRSIFREWKRATRECELSEQAMFDRMRDEFDYTADTKEYWGLVISDDATTDISGAGAGVGRA
jgi:P4 family phage/plasmid primase-like protien